MRGLRCSCAKKKSCKHLSLYQDSHVATAAHVLPESTTHGERACYMVLNALQHV